MRAAASQASADIAVSLWPTERTDGAERTVGEETGAMFIDDAVCVDGDRTEPSSLEETSETVRDRGGFAWIGMLLRADEVPAA